jgi:anaerobic magnesium-protoporphyrin IX monomethyl ester cyclase
MKVAVLSDNGQSNVDEYDEQALGPAYISQSAKDSGHEVHLYNQFPNVNKLTNYDVVAISANSRDVQDVLKISRDLKSAKKSLITIVGGTHISGEIFDFNLGEINKNNLPFLYSSNLDYFVAGEGDTIFPNLLNFLERKTDVPKGVYYWSNGKLVFSGYESRIDNLDSLTFPTDFRDSKTFEIKLTNLTDTRITSIPIIESRGCPGQKGKTCQFCSSEANWGRQIRYRSGKNILQEVDEVIEKFGLNPQEVNVFLDSLELMVNQSKFYDLLDSFKETPYSIGSCGDIRKATKESLKKMAEAGYNGIFWGIESLDQMILSKYKAGLKFEEIERGLHLTQDAGIKNTGMFIMGFPEETEESIKEWTSRLSKLPLDSLRIGIATPFPGTEFRRDLVQKGISIEDYTKRWDTSHLVYNHPTIKKEKMEDLRREVISKFKEKISKK